MTATTSPATRAPRLSLPGVLRSERIKLTSLRSTTIAGVAFILLIVAGMALRAFAYADAADRVHLGVPTRDAWEAVIAIGVQSGVLAAIVLAVLAAGSEHTGRAALTTYTAAPRRLVVLGAKAAVVVAAVGLLTAAGLVLGVLASAPLLSAARLGGPSADTLGTGVSAVLLLVVWAFLSVAVTTVLRSTAAGITAVLAVLLVVPVAAELLGLVTGADLGGLTFSYAATVTTGAIHDPGALRELGRELPVLLAWLVGTGAAATAALTRRDV